MSYKWNDSDKKIWDASEVLKEFEKRLARAAIELAKKAGATEEVNALTQSTQEVQESLGEVIQTVKDEIASADDESTAEEDDAMARDSLINELREMAIEASKTGNIKLAYKIERTVDELVFGD